MMGFERFPIALDIVEFGRIFGPPLGVSQCLRSAGAAGVALLAWMGPLSRTMVTGLHAAPGLGPWIRSSCSSRAMKSALHLVCEVTTVSWRETKSRAPIMAIFCDWPGASTRKSAPRFAQVRAR